MFLNCITSLSVIDRKGFRVLSPIHPYLIDVLLITVEYDMINKFLSQSKTQSYKQVVSKHRLYLLYMLVP